MKLSTTLSLIIILSFFATKSSAQNIGIGVAIPLQKLHVGGNIRVDGMATPGTGVITTNASGDLLRTDFSGNVNDVLKGNGTFGTVPGGLPSGAIIGSTSSTDANLVAAGYSFYGDLSSKITTYTLLPASTSSQFTQAPTYENGNASKTPPPPASGAHLGLWTGSEVLIWGGVDLVGTVYNFFNEGSRYNPLTDNWTTMSTVNAPSSRGYTAGVWTGTEMLLWSGLDSAYVDGVTETYEFTTDGGKYNVSSNTWTTMSTTGAPTPRFRHSAIWTGTYMVVWGGQDSLELPDGGRYNPSTNSWLPVSTSINSPGSSYGSKMYWTGTYALILGNQDSIGRYNPSTNTWATVTTVPGGSYSREASIWTGSELWLFDQGNNQILKYNPSSDNWTTTVITDIFPEPDFTVQSTVWSDSEMILFGNVSNSGNPPQNRYIRYNPNSNAYITSTADFIRNNKFVEYETLFIKTGSMIFKWGGYSIEVDDNNITTYNFSRQGTRIYLSSGISIPPIYISGITNKPLYLFRRN